MFVCLFPSFWFVALFVCWLVDSFARSFFRWFVFSFIVSSISWFVQLSIDWFVGSFDWLLVGVCSSVDYVSPFARWLTGWFVDWFVRWLVRSFIDWVVRWFVDWFARWLTEWFVGSLIDWVVPWLVRSLVGSHITDNGYIGESMMVLTGKQGFILLQQRSCQSSEVFYLVAVDDI